MTRGARARVVVGDGGYDLEQVRLLLDGIPVTVSEGRGPWGGDDVVALLVGTETEVRAADLDRLAVLEGREPEGAVP